MHPPCYNKFSSDCEAAGTYLFKKQAPQIKLLERSILMSEYSGHQKICATCAYWIAQRDTDFSNSRVKDCANEGRCASRKGPTGICAGSPSPVLVPIIKSGRCFANAPQQKDPCNGCTHPSQGSFILLQLLQCQSVAEGLAHLLAQSQIMMVHRVIGDGLQFGDIHLTLCI